MNFAELAYRPGRMPTSWVWKQSQDSSCDSEFPKHPFDPLLSRIGHSSALKVDASLRLGWPGVTNGMAVSTKAKNSREL